MARYSAPIIEASPYLMHALQHPVVEEVIHEKEQDVNGDSAKMNILQAGALELAREKIRKRKQLEEVLRIGKERLEAEEGDDREGQGHSIQVGTGDIFSTKKLSR